MTRIAVGGFLHETNTFAPTKATYADFVHGGGWPSMAHGAEVLKVMQRSDVKEAWAKQGAVPMPMAPVDFDKYLRSDIEKWAQVVKVSGAKAE